MSTVVPFPQQGFLRLSQVLKLIPISKATWYKGIKKGHYPKPVQLGPRCVGWKAEDLEQLMNQLKGGIEGEAPGTMRRC